MMRLLGFIIVVLLLASCSFNKMFLRPTPLASNLHAINMKMYGDTLSATFDTINHEPMFLDKRTHKPKDPGYLIESVVYKSTDGNLINGWMLKPKGGPIAGTIIHCHGNSGCMLSQQFAITPLINKGFQIFMFDYSGFGFSTGKATKKNVLADGLATIDYVTSREDVKGTKVILYGQSLGAHLSAVLGAKRESKIDALVIEGAFSSHKDIAAKSVPVLGRIFTKQSYCAKRSIKNYHKPLLVVHSKDDEVCPFKQGKKIYDNANAPKEFYEIDKCHICGPWYYAQEIADRIKKMIDAPN